LIGQPEVIDCYGQHNLWRRFRCRSCRRAAYAYVA